VPELGDVMKEHHAYVKQITDQGKACDCWSVSVQRSGGVCSEFSIFRVGGEQTAKLLAGGPDYYRAGLLRTEIHPWGTGKGVLAAEAADGVNL